MSLYDLNKDELILLIQTCRKDLEKELEKKNKIIDKCLKLNLINKCVECAEICVGKYLHKCVYCSKILCEKHLIHMSVRSGAELNDFPFCKSCAKKYNYA
jgi:hypothetical protein